MTTYKKAEILIEQKGKCCHPEWIICVSLKKDEEPCPCHGNCAKRTEDERVEIAKKYLEERKEEKK